MHYSYSLLKDISKCVHLPLKKRQSQLDFSVQNEKYSQQHC